MCNESLLAKPFSPTSRRSFHCLMAIASSMASRVTRLQFEASCENGLNNETRCCLWPRLKAARLASRSSTQRSHLCQWREPSCSMICSYPPKQGSPALDEAFLVQRHITHERSALSGCRSQRPSQTKQVSLSMRLQAGGVTRFSMCTTSPQTSNHSIERISDRLPLMSNVRLKSGESCACESGLRMVRLRR